MHRDKKYICPCPQIGFNAHSGNLLLWDTISTRHCLQRTNLVISYVGLVLRDILSEAELVLLKEIPREVGECFGKEFYKSTIMQHCDIELR